MAVMHEHHLVRSARLSCVRCPLLSGHAHSLAHPPLPDRAASGTPVTLLFASDVHLSAHRPAAVEAFLTFLSGPVRQVDRLYILGDLFDQWLGDDDDRAPHLEIEAALAETAAAGVSIDLVHGNHDFLLGGAFARRTGCRLVDEPFVIEIAGQRIVLLHGDTLCTRDVEYQAFRRYARDPGNQRAFLARPIEDRMREAAALRTTSSARSRLKPEDIMDVTPEEVVRVLWECGATWMVHGHTHRPAVHKIETETGPSTRIVLGDWYEQGTVLVWDKQGCRLRSPEELSA